MYRTHHNENLHYVSGGWDPFYINNFAFSINNELISQGKIALKFPNSQIQNLLITLDLGLLDTFWCHFWTLSIFHVFGSEISFLIPFIFEKITKFLRGWDAFFVKNLPSIFPRGKSLLNLRFFSNFVKNLDCSYLLIKGS